jgi:hypothetical protein
MMRSMTRMAVAGCMALAALGAVGAPAQADAPANPFAGSWSGTWTAVAVEGHGGAFDWTISDAGRITGTVTHPAVGNSGTLVGQVRADGRLTFVGMAPSDTPGSAGNGIPFQGTAVIDGDGKLVASADRMDTFGPIVAVLERY